VEILEILSLEFFTALLTIILIDLVLAGDNALVIGLAARNLPQEMQKKVIIMGTAGAVIIRAVATLLVVKLLDIPWLMLVGGLLLIWIAFKLLIEEKSHNIEAKTSLWPAVRTIIIADAAMGVDNVIAVAGAAHGDFLLVVLGLIISLPIMVWGSTLLIKWMDRYPSIIYIGAGILAWTAAKMITHEAELLHFFEEYALAKWGTIVFIIVAVLVMGKWVNARRAAASSDHQNNASSSV
jgi:YjbE family integral membrane protein